MAAIIRIRFIFCITIRPNTNTGCLQLLEILGNLLEFKKLLEILEIALNLYGPPWNFCAKCQWPTALVSNHDKTGYRIAYLRNWSPFYLCHTPMLCMSCFCSTLGKLVDAVHCVACRSNANMSWIFLELPPGISCRNLEICSVKFVDTLEYTIRLTIRSE